MSNTSPVITVDSNDIGTKSATFDFSFTVTDADEDSISGVIKIDNTPVFILNEIELDEENIITIQDTALESLSQGSHTITIQVTDGTDTVTQNIAFNRAATIFMDRKATISKQNLVDLTSGILEEIVSLMGDGSGGLDLSNYYTKTQVDNLISLIPTFDIEVVQSLPAEDISQSTVYLLTSASALSQNSYTEYIYVNNNWEKLGEGTVDLSGYYTSTQVNSLVNALNANLAQNYSSSSTYSVGDFVIYENQLYKCKTAISSGESFNSSKWDATSLENELGELGESGGSGHTIKDSSDTSMTARSALKFGGDLVTTDDSTNSQTVVTPHELTSADMAEIMADLPSGSGGSGGSFSQVQSDWEESDTTSAAYIQNKPTLGMNYSTDEQEVGTWIDGKPLYQKTIPFTGDINSSSLTLASIPNIQLCYATGVIYENEGGRYIIPEGGSRIVQNTINNNDIVIARIDGHAYKAVSGSYATIQYTKSTDTAS